MTLTRAQRGPFDRGAVIPAQLDFLYLKLPTSTAANVALAVLLVTVLWPVVDPLVAGIWLGLMVGAQAARLWLWRRRRKEMPEGIHARVWLTRFRVGVIATGALWGSAAWVLFPADAVLYQVFVAFVLAGLTAGAITSLAPDRASVLGFVGLALTPLMLSFLAEGTAVPLAMATMILLYLGFIAASATDLRRLLTEHFALARHADGQAEELRQHLAVQQLVSDIAARLLAADAQAVDAVIDESLARAGRLLGVDRAYLMLRSDSGTHVSNTHEWSAPGVAPQKEELQEFPLALIPWWWSQVIDGKMLAIPDVATMPPEAAQEQAIFESLGLKALCTFPVRKGQEVDGFIGFDDACAPRDWSGQTVELLGLMAHVVGSALGRIAGERALDANRRLLHATLESGGSGVLAVDAEGEVLFANGRFHEMWGLPHDLATDGVATDEDLLASVGDLLTDAGEYRERVRRLYRSAESSEELVELVDGRAFQRHSRPLWEDGRLAGRVWTFLDVTERVQAERRAHLASERLDTAQRFAGIGTWEWDILSGHATWTESVYALLGHRDGDFDPSFDRFLALVHPDDRQEVADAVTRSLEGAVPYELEHRVVWPDGTSRWLLSQGNVVRNLQGEPVRMLGITQDIDHQKRVRLALAKRERQLLEAQELASLGHWDADLVTGQLEWSPEVFRIFGRDPSGFEPTVEAFHASVHPDDRELVRVSERRALATRKHDVIHRIIRPDGAVRHIHELARMELDTLGSPLRLLGTVQDVTDRTLAEEEVRSATARLALATRTVNLGMWEYDPIRDHLVWNREMYALTGVAPDAFVPSYATWDSLLHPDDRMRSARGVEAVRQEALEKRPPHGLAQQLAAGGSLEATFRIVRADTGETRWMRGSRTTMLNGEGVPTHMVGTVLDVTEFVLARERAEEASRTKSDFLTSMSHELRTPLNAILGFGQLLEYDEGLSEDQRENVREILRGSHHLLTLINEVLDLARVESGTVELSLEPVVVCDVLEECIALMAPLGGERGIGITHEGILRAAVRADRTRLRQVIFNLLSNAVKYNRDGGMVRVLVNASGPASLRISVRDTGVGIAPGRLEDVFEPFNRIGAETGSIEGTGIGLTLTRHLTEAMGGIIGVESRVGVGSTFWLEFAREADQEPEHPAPTTSRGEESGAEHARASAAHTALYIEDNPANIKLVTQVLKRIPGLHLFTAHTPQLGIELARVHGPSLILLDINLPGMNGFEVLEVLKSDPTLAATPVIAVTANAMPRDVERGLAAGFVAYVTKPLEIEHFVQTVRRALHGETV